METERSSLGARWLYLILGTLCLSFAGVIYAWSILKAPLAAEFGWSNTALALNFTLTMCTFCIGGFLGSRISRAIGSNLTLVFAGFLSGSGLALASLMNGNIALLYVSYAGMCGLGIGVAYNVIISSVGAWFPDRRGLCSGCLLMGFGLTSLVFGSALDALFAAEGFGWRKTFLIFGITLTVCICLCGFLLRKPSDEVVFPEPKKVKVKKAEGFEKLELSPMQMLRRPSFWLCFIYTTCLCAVGNSVISFARDLALSTGAEAALATTLVGVLSTCNGIGRILTGALFDSAGRRFTMIATNILTIAAAALTLSAVLCGSLPLCIVGLCLTGLSYGSCPTVSSAFVSSFYGQRHFATNYSIINFNLFAASFIATACASLRTASGGFTAPFVLLLSLSCIALALNVCVKKP
ncbi:MAG: MFS transporter [Eubacteriales bacterium]